MRTILPAQTKTTVVLLTFFCCRFSGGRFVGSRLVLVLRFVCGRFLRRSGFCWCLLCSGFFCRCGFCRWRWCFFYWRRLIHNDTAGGRVKAEAAGIGGCFASGACRGGRCCWRLLGCRGWLSRCLVGGRSSFSGCTFWRCCCGWSGASWSLRCRRGRCCWSYGCGCFGLLLFFSGLSCRRLFYRSGFVDRRLGSGGLNGFTIRAELNNTAGSRIKAESVFCRLSGGGRNRCC